MNDWYIVITSLIFSAFFSGMEIAYVSSNKLKIELGRKKGLLSARILTYFVKNPSKILGTLLLGNNIALVIYGIFMAQILEPKIIFILTPLYHSEFLVLLIQTLVSTLLILIVAEFIPKVLFRLNSNGILQFFAVPVNLFYWLLFPVVHFIVTLSEWIIRKVFRVEYTAEQYSFSPVDLDNYIREFTPEQDKESVVKQEIQMLQNAIGFKHVKLRECMVPRTEIIALEESDTIEQLIKTFIETGHSKVLIYHETIDNIIGFVHTSNMFSKPESIKSLVRPVLIFPETMLADSVLNQFIIEHKSIAVVVDEFGGTSGMITMEDIIEEIFGEIEDEYDVEDLTEKRLDDDTYLFSARLEIDYLNDKFGLNLPESEEYETLGGLIIKVHESIPRVQEIIVYDSFRFIIHEASESRIDLVKVVVNSSDN